MWHVHVYILSILCDVLNVCVYCANQLIAENVEWYCGSFSFPILFAFLKSASFSCFYRERVHTFIHVFSSSFLYKRISNTIIAQWWWMKKKEDGYVHANIHSHKCMKKYGFEGTKYMCKYLFLVLYLVGDNLTEYYFIFFKLFISNRQHILIS